MRITLETGAPCARRVHLDFLVRAPFEANIAASVGSVGSSYDNALAETINGLFKTELIKPRAPWTGVDPVEFATAEWVDWYNHRRIYEHCGDIPPAELEKVHYAGLTQPFEELELSHH